jgi:hypothetical protein
VLSGAMISMGRTLEKPGPALYSPECVEKKGNSPKFAVAICAPIAPLLWPQTGPRRNFFSISSTIATTVTRILYKGLRLATVRSSENFLR